MLELQRLHAGHSAAVLAMELADRTCFAASISDRGDEFFDQFAEWYSASLVEQDTGDCGFYVLVADGGAVLGRFNLYDIHDGTANLGYRVAEEVAGRDLATAAVQSLWRLAAEHHGLHTLRAATPHRNVASQRVLVKAGFVPVSPVDPADLGGTSGTWYQRNVTLEP